MGATNEYSTQYAAAVNTVPSVHQVPSEIGGRVRYIRANFTQGAAAGDATSTSTLAKLPARARVLGHLSKIYFSSFGAARTLDVGYAAGTSILDGSAITADPDLFATAVDVSSAGSMVLDEAGTSGALHGKRFDGEVDILATVAGGTIPAAATIDMHLFYVVD